MALHSKKSPSAAHILHNCPGALALAESLPEKERRSSIASQRGTAAHYLLQVSLEESKHPEAYLCRLIGIRDGDAEWIEESTESYERVFEVDSHMVSAVAIAHNYIRRRKASLWADELTLETRTNPLPDRDDSGGIADATIIGLAELEVADYKNGRIPVEVKGNPQCLAYLLGRAHDTGWRHKRYRITIIQPNAAHADGPVRSQACTAEELRAFSELHRKACELADRAADEFGETPLSVWSSQYLNAGEHCTFCKAAGPCVTRAALTAEQARIAFAEEPSMEPLEQCAQVFRFASQIRAHLEAAEEYLLQALLSGRKVEGFKLVQRRTVKKWRPDIPRNRLVSKILEAGYIKDRASLFKRGKLISGSQAEKLVDPNRRQAFSDEYLFKPTGELTIALDSDPRAAERV